MSTPPTPNLPSNIAVVGCGAMGSIFATLLSGAGNEVLAVHRGQAHVDAINADGLTLDGPTGQWRASIRAVTTAPSTAMDLVILAVKAADVAGAATASLPMIGDDTIVMAMQNGLGSADVVAGIVGGGRLVVGIASGFGASMIGPGHAKHNAMQAIRLGAHSDLPTARVQAVARLWSDAGFDAAAVDDIAAMQWEKLICNVAYSAPCALSGLTVGEVMDDELMGPISRGAAIEAWAVAKALGIAVAVDDPVALVRTFGARMPKARPSAMQDHEAGRVSEIDVINGAVSANGVKAGVTTPINDTMVALVRVKERRWRGSR